MKTGFLKITALVLISLYFSTGCTFDTKEDWEKLPDRKFYFTEFQFILLDQNKEDAFRFYKEFPVKKIMFMLAKEYNITIDISDFKQFININKPSVIQADGFMRTEKHTWNKKKTENNRIVFIFERDYFEDSKQKLRIAIYSGDTTLKVINAEFSKIDYIFTQLDFHLKTGTESLKEYETANYGTTTPIPMVIEINNNSMITEEPANLMKIKSMIDEYVKSLDENGKNDFKHDIIDYIYEKCK
jgi:hypothetical protein